MAEVDLTAGGDETAVDVYDLLYIVFLASAKTFFCLFYAFCMHYY